MTFKIIQDIIDRLRGKIFGLKPMVTKAVLAENLNDMRTLIIGSSHIEFGYIPSNDEICLASPSQDLYNSYYLYKLFSQKYKNLKNIIVSFSVFTPGHSLIKTGHANLCILYKYLYGINYQSEEDAKNKNLYRLEKWYSDEINKYRNEVSYPSDYRGARMLQKKDFKPFNIKEIHERALKHLKNNRREVSQMVWAEKILQEASQNGHNVYFVIPPFTSIYKEVLPSAEELFKELYSLNNNFTNSKIIV